MTTDQMIEENSKLLREIIIRGNIIEMVIAGLMICLVVLAVWILVAEHREKMRKIRSIKEKEEWDQICDEHIARGDPYWRRM